MAVYNDMTPADIAAVTGNNNRNNGMWGGDWAAMDRAVSNLRYIRLGWHGLWRLRWFWRRHARR